MEVDGHCLSYDANGNQSTGYNFSKRRSRTLTWTPYNKPRTIQEGATTLTFSYGADRARFKQTNTATNLTTYYIGGLYEKQVNSVTGLTTHVHYIKAGGTTIATYKVKENTNTSNTNSNTNTTVTGTSTEAITELHYLHRDHLGSVTEITDENAAVVERLAYDAWGKRRAATWADALAQLSSNQTLRGFTGHEMLDDVSLIHMNGRVYDPDLGRFLSADPFIQQAANPQSFNRYSYVGNNPLSFTDPSGFFFKKLLKGIGKVFKGIGKAIKSVLRAIGKVPILRTAVVIAAGIACGPYGPACAAAAAGSITAASGGGLSDVFSSAITAAVTFNSVGSDPGLFDIAVISAQANSSIFDGIDNQKSKQEVAEVAAGGITLDLGGAKFANGALTRAYDYVLDMISAIDPLILERIYFGLDITEYALIAIALSVDIATIPSGEGILIAGGVRTGIAATKRKLKDLFKSAGKRKTCSFVAGTMVATPTGLRAIEEIKEGEFVLARDDKTGEMTRKRVNAAYHSEHDDVLMLTIRQTDGEEEVIITTSEHPFYVKDKAWVSAEQLTVDDDLTTLAGKQIDLLAIEALSGIQTAYNFEIADFHTYAVGESQVWVHNACDRNGRRGGNARDRKQVDDVAKEKGIDRREFGDFIEEMKRIVGKPGNDNFTYKELRKLANEFKNGG